MPKSSGLTLGQWLGHIVEEANMANLLGVKVTLDVVSKNTMDVVVPIGEHRFEVDGASVAPADWFGLDSFTAEVETDVEISKDEDGNPEGLSLLMKRRLMKRGARVKFKVKLGRRGEIEAFEILRAAANSELVRAAAKAGIEVKVKGQENQNG